MPISRAQIADRLETPFVQNAILGVIIFNAILLGFETSQTMMTSYGPVLYALDKACLAFFVLEIVLKLTAYGSRFFTRAWNWFDLVIVGISLVPGSGQLSVLRALRILRLLRVISVAPRLRRVVEGFISALPGMGSVFILMGLIFYIFSVMATKLYGHTFPDWFGSLGQSAYSLFQVMTLESWSMGIVRPVMEVHPYAWAFFVPFIMMTTFAVVNLLVGLIVNSMQDAHAQDDAANRDAYREDVLAKLDTISARLQRLEEKDRSADLIDRG